MLGLTEAQLKASVLDYLTYGMNQGKWWFTRLNSGKAFVKRGGKDYMIQLCDEGTFDLLVIKGRFMEDGRMFGRPLIYFIELKVGRGRLSPAQEAFRILIEMQGCNAVVARSLEELEKVLSIEGG